MVIFGDKDGNIVGMQTSQGYPAPADYLAKLREQLDPAFHMLDVPPLDSMNWLLPPDADAPIIKPKLAATVSKETAKANETDVIFLQGVPEGAQVLFGGAFDGQATADGKPIALTFSGAGTHDIRIRTRGHQEQRLQVVSSSSATTKKKLSIPQELQDGTHQIMVVGMTGADYARQVNPLVESAIEAEIAPLRAFLSMEPAADEVLAGSTTSRLIQAAQAAGEEPSAFAQNVKDKVSAYWTGEGRKAATAKAMLAFMQGDPRKAEVEQYLKKEAIQIPDGAGINGQRLMPTS